VPTPLRLPFALPALIAAACAPDPQGQEETVDLRPYRGTGADCGSFFEMAGGIETGISTLTDYAAFATATTDGTAQVTPDNEESLEGALVLQAWDLSQVSSDRADYILADGRFLGYDVSFADGGFPWSQAQWCLAPAPTDDTAATDDATPLLTFLGELETADLVDQTWLADQAELPDQAMLVVLMQCDPEADPGCVAGEANYGSASLIASLTGALFSILPGSCDIAWDDACDGVRLADTEFPRIPENLMTAGD
jgi:hypothetical protein